MNGTASLRALRLPLLINRNFTFLWVGTAISTVGDFVFDTTVVLWVATTICAGRSWAPMAVTGVLIAASLPMLLVGPFSGVFTDRWDKRRTMLAADAARTLLIASLLPVALLPGLPLWFRLGAVYAVVLCAAICSQFFMPARISLISDVVAEGDERTRASGLSQMTTHMSALMGPPLAGPLFIVSGPEWGLAVNALSYALSFAAVYAVHTVHVAGDRPSGGRPDARAEFVAGLRFFAGSRVLVAVLLSSLIVMAGAGALNALDYFFVRENLHASNALYGFATAGIAAGALTGALLTTVFIKKISPATVFTAGLLLTGLGMVVYSRMTAFVPGVAVLFLTGIPMAALNVAVMGLIFNVTPREMLGRVSSIVNPSMALVSLLSMAVAGYLVSTVLRSFHAHVLGTAVGPVDLLFLVAGLLGIAAGVYAGIALLGPSGRPQQIEPAGQAVA